MASSGAVACSPSVDLQKGVLAPQRKLRVVRLLERPFLECDAQLRDARGLPWPLGLDGPDRPLPKFVYWPERELAEDPA